MNLKDTIRYLEQFNEEIRVGASAGTIAFRIKQEKHLLRYLASTEQGFNRQSMLGLVHYAHGGDRSSTTASHIVAYAKRFATWLYNNDIEPKDHGRGIRVKTDTPIYRAPVIPFEKYHAALMASDPMVAYLFAMAYFTGMALCDCVNIRWEDIDMSVGIIRLRRRKTGTPFEVPLKDNSVLMDHLNALREDFERNPPAPFPFDPEGRPNTFVCAKAALTWKTGTSLHNRLKWRLKRAGLPEVTFHGVRRAFISRLIKRGIEPMLVAKMVGHKNVKEVMRYTTIDDETTRSHESAIYETS